MANNKSTTGRTTINEINTLHQKITDPFKKIIRKVLSEQHNILMKRKKELETWDKESQKKFKEAFGFFDEKARAWILDGVNKEIALNETIPLSNFIKTNENVYGSVNSTDLEHKISIGRKFLDAPLAGKDSQVVTLCHEMSHFDDILATKDLGGKNPRKYAIKLAENGDEKTMQNSYNFEMYFE